MRVASDRGGDVVPEFWGILALFDYDTEMRGRQTTSNALESSPSRE
jgi:hypothetical protein